MWSLPHVVQSRQAAVRTGTGQIELAMASTATATTTLSTCLVVVHRGSLWQASPLLSRLQEFGQVSKATAMLTVPWPPSQLPLQQAQLSQPSARPQAAPQARTGAPAP